MRRGRARSRKQICVGARLPLGEGIRGVWDQVQGRRLRRQRLGISTMAWVLLLVTFVTQGSGEASREGTLENSG